MLCPRVCHSTYLSFLQILARGHTTLSHVRRGNHYLSAAFTQSIILPCLQQIRSLRLPAAGAQSHEILLCDDRRSASRENSVPIVVPNGSHRCHRRRRSKPPCPIRASLGPRPALETCRNSPFSSFSAMSRQRPLHIVLRKVLSQFSEVSQAVAPRNMVSSQDSAGAHEICCAVYAAHTA